MVMCIINTHFSVVKDRTAEFLILDLIGQVSTVQYYTRVR